MPGLGGEVRTYYLTRIATEIGDVTLVSLGGSDGTVRVPPDIAKRCVAVIEPGTISTDARDPGHRPRVQRWVEALAVVAMPWRNQWSDFFRYWLQYGQAGRDTDQQRKWSRWLLSRVIHAEFYLASWTVGVPPLSGVLFGPSFQGLEAAVARLMQREEFDVVWLENTVIYAFVKRMLRHCRGVRPPILCDGHNIETEVQRRIAVGARSDAERKFGETQTRLMRQLETEAFRASSLVVQCSERDAQLGRAMSPVTEFCVVDNGVNSDYFRSGVAAERHERPTVVFTAGFGYRPNREGLAFFLREVFPLVRRERPNCRFVFAGSQASDMKTMLAAHAGSVECHSDPEDIRPYFEEAWVCVAPLLIGGGTRLKILEAMSMGRAVVSTSVGIEGLRCEDGKHLMVADDAPRFAEAILALFKDPDRRSGLENDAKRWVRENYEWDIICHEAATRLRRFLDDLDSPRTLAAKRAAGR